MLPIIWAPVNLVSVQIGYKCSDELVNNGGGRTHGAPFRGYGYVPLRNGGNVVTRIGTQQQNKQWRDWTDARRPIPRLWIRSAGVRGGGGGGGGGGC